LPRGAKHRLASWPIGGVGPERYAGKMAAVRLWKVSLLLIGAAERIVLDAQIGQHPPGQGDTIELVIDSERIRARVIHVSDPPPIFAGISTIAADEIE
jgi:hypothetical protein